MKASGHTIKMKTSLTLVLLFCFAASTVFADDETFPEVSEGKPEEERPLEPEIEEPGSVDEDEGEFSEFAYVNLEEFLEAFKLNDKEAMAKFTIDIVKYSKRFQRKAKLMVLVKSNILKMVKRFVDLDNFARMRKGILGLLLKLDSRDVETPGRLQAMISWIQKRRIDGRSADANLDDAESRLTDALNSFNNVQKAVVAAVEGLQDSMGEAEFDQEKVRTLINAVVSAASESQSKFLPSIQAAVQDFDQTIVRLRLGD